MLAGLSKTTGCPRTAQLTTLGLRVVTRNAAAYGRLEAANPTEGILRLCRTWLDDEAISRDGLAALSNLCDGRTECCMIAMLRSRDLPAVIGNAFHQFYANGDIVHSAALLIDRAKRHDEAEGLTLDPSTLRGLAAGARHFASSEPPTASMCLEALNRVTRAEHIEAFAESGAVHFICRGVVEARPGSVLSRDSMRSDRSALRPALRSVAKAFSDHMYVTLRSLVVNAASVSVALQNMVDVSELIPELQGPMTNAMGTCFLLLTNDTSVRSSRTEGPSRLISAVDMVRRASATPRPGLSLTSPKAMALAECIPSVAPAQMVLVGVLRDLQAGGAGVAQARKAARWATAYLAEAAYNVGSRTCLIAGGVVQQLKAALDCAARSDPAVASSCLEALWCFSLVPSGEAPLRRCDGLGESIDVVCACHHGNESVMQYAAVIKGVLGGSRG